MIATFSFMIDYRVDDLQEMLPGPRLADVIPAARAFS